MRIFAKKTKVALIVLFVVLFVSVGNGWAGFKKTVAIAPLANPWNFSGDYNPGAMISEEIKRRLKALGGAVLVSVEEAETIPALKRYRLLKPQIIVKGRILKFLSNIPKVESSTVSLGSFQEQAEVEIEIELVSAITGAILSGRKLTATSFNGTVYFKNNVETLEFGHPGFLHTSLGLALESLISETVLFILGELKTIPLEAQVISVDENKEEVLINVGRAHGIEPSDDFVVYSVSRDHIDPFNDSNLGDRFVKKGVIRIKNVNEGFSEGVIMAGENFAMSDVARSREKAAVSKVSSVSDSFSPGPSGDYYNWDDYRGLKQGIFRTFRTPYGEFDATDLMMGGFLIVLLIG